ncbi:MAG: hypothetical protein OER82_04565 [Nitrosopumilus sp.]|nr:hypothetical protein [Nitrosopumilus sp.]
MNKSLRYIAILPLFTAGLTTNYFTDVEALKGEGVGSSKYGSTTNVCGLQLCSEIPGGKDVWIGQESEDPIALVVEDTDEMKDPHEDKLTDADLGSVLRLSRANVPATIPMHQGYYNGGDVHFIITDSSDPTHADVITENQGWQVELAPLLKNAPDAALSKIYVFTNGVEGDGIHGWQSEVFTSTPAQADVYSALTSHVHVM